MENTSTNIKVDISPVEAFDTGIQISHHSKCGNEFDTISNTLPELYKTSDYTVGIKLGLVDESKGAACLEVLNSLKGLLAGVPQFQEALENGCALDFRHVGKDIFIDMHISKNYEDVQKISKKLDKVKIENVDWMAKVDFSITSGVNPAALLTATPEDVMKMASNLSIKMDGEYSKLISLLKKIYDDLVSTDELGKKTEKNLMLSHLLTAYTSAGFTFKYIPEVILSTIKNILGEAPVEQMTALQMTGNGFVQSAQHMAPMFIGPYIDVLKAVNFSDYEIHAYCPRIRLYCNLCLAVPSLNTFVHDNFLQG